MKREFLQNLKVGEEALPKEAIDAIMDENGKDIERAKANAVKPYADYDDLKAENQRLKDNPGEVMVDGKTAQQWKDDYDNAVAAHATEVAGIKFEHVLNAAITAAHGRNTKAITALLDVETLRGSEDQSAAITAALEDLKKDNGYLFGKEETPPPYAGGTGVTHNPSSGGNETLAGALREKFTNK